MTCGECGNVTAPGAGFPNHVYCKRFLLHMEKREDASRCRDFIPKPQTHADRIRSMTDGELAFLIGNGCPPESVKPCRMYLSVDGDTNCTDCWLDWLKSPVEET